MTTDLNDPNTPAEMTSTRKEDLSSVKPSRSFQYHLVPEWRSDLPEVCTLSSTPRQSIGPSTPFEGLDPLAQYLDGMEISPNMNLEDRTPCSREEALVGDTLRRMALAESNLAATASPAITDVNAVLQERGSRYGPFVGHAEITIRLKAVIHEELNKRGKELKEDQIEALHMIANKIGRIINGDPDYADNWVGISGYASLVQKRLEGEIL